MNKAENQREGNTVKLLSEMYRNVTMGSENLASVVAKVSDPFLLTDITCQLEKYAGFAVSTEKQLQKRDVTPEEPSGMQKLMARGSIGMNTLFDPSQSHIAQMIARGTKMGADQLEDTLVTFGDGNCDREAVELCRAIIRFERREADKMGAYC